MKEEERAENALPRLTPIGVIRSERTRAEDTPIQPSFAEGSAGTVEVFPEYAVGLKDIEGFSHLILLFRLHRAEAPLLRLLSAPIEDTFDICDTDIVLPDAAVIRETAMCANCGEEVMVSRTVKRGERLLWAPCAKEKD